MRPTTWTNPQEWNESKPDHEAFTSQFCEDHGYVLVTPHILRQATLIKKVIVRVNPSLTHDEIAAVMRKSMEIDYTSALAVAQCVAYSTEPQEYDKLPDLPGLHDSFRAAVARWKYALDAVLWDHFMRDTAPKFNMWRTYPAAHWSRLLDQYEAITPDSWTVYNMGDARDRSKTAQTVADMLHAADGWTKVGGEWVPLT